jgi:membrane protein YdbS with pleckstrin-like domain
MSVTTDPEIRLGALERWVIDLLLVPTAPEPPDGSPESIRVFHAGRNFYLWSVLVWAGTSAAIFAGLIAVSAVISTRVLMTSGWIRGSWLVLLSIVWISFFVTLIVTLVARRLNYLLRWYIVTDRSLRIRSGVFRVDELTMTYGNVQEIRVTAGPLQHLLGLPDVEVQAAGGGGEKHDRKGHVGHFEGVSNAAAIRDLIVERLRQYRDSGLGDAPVRATVDDPAAIAAARALLEEASALRRLLG